jgi:F-type H+-transporting ATPase subunit delta
MAIAPPEQQRQQAAHYANALTSLGMATGMLDRIEQELPEVATLFESHEELRRFLARQDVHLEGKLRAVEAILSEALAPPLVQLLLTMIQAGDMILLAPMLSAFDSAQANTRERISGDVESAVPLSDDKLQELEHEVSRIVGKRVRLHPRISRSMLGGLRVRVGDIVIDGSIDAQLNALHEKLLS